MRVRLPIRILLAIAAFLCVFESTQFPIPARFRPVGHEAVVRIDVHEPVTCVKSASYCAGSTCAAPTCLRQM